VFLTSALYLRNKSWKLECVGSFNMDWQILVFYPEPEARFSASVNINYRLTVKAYYRICTLRHIRIEINHGSQNVF
jgi:hypothetical protein